MKRNQFLLLFLLSLTVFSACTSKKDRLTADTLVLTIEPPQTVINRQAQKTFTAVGRSAAGTSDDIDPSWFIDNSALGSFSPSKGKTVTFNASQTLGTTKIYAQYGGVQASGDLTVVSSDVVVNPSVPSKELDIFRENAMIPGAIALLLDVPNPPTTYGAKLSAFSTNTFITTVTGTIGVDHTEGAQGLRIDIGDGTGNGIGFSFGSDGNPGSGPLQPTNLSAFTGATLKFDVKTTQDLRFEIQYQSFSHHSWDYVAQYIPLDGNWHTISVRLDSFPNSTFGNDISQVTVPFLIIPSDVSTPTNFSYYIDNVRWEKS